MKLEKSLFTVRVACSFLKLFIICGILTPFILTGCNNDEPTPEPFNFTMNVKLLPESQALVAPYPSGIETREIGKTDVEYIQLSISEPLDRTMNIGYNYLSYPDLLQIKVTDYDLYEMKNGEYEEQYNMYFQLPEKPYKGVAFWVNVKYKFKDNKYTLLEAVVNEGVITPLKDNILDILITP